MLKISVMGEHAEMPTSGQKTEVVHKHNSMEKKIIITQHHKVKAFSVFPLVSLQLVQLMLFLILVEVLVAAVSPKGRSHRVKVNKHLSKCLPQNTLTLRLQCKWRCTAFCDDS